MSTIVGYKTGNPGGLPELWSPTYDWADLTLGESVFLPVTTPQDCVEAIIRRSPAGGLLSTYPWFSICEAAGSVVRHYPHPRLTSPGYAVVREIVEAVERLGPLCVAGGYVHELHRRPEYQLSDLRTAHVPGSHYHLLQLDPVVGKARRTRAANKSKRRAKREEQARLDGIAAAEQVKTTAKVMKIWTRFDLLMGRAYMALSKTVVQELRPWVLLGLPSSGTTAGVHAYLSLFRRIRSLDRRCFKANSKFPVWKGGEPTRHPMVRRALLYLAEHSPRICDQDPYWTRDWIWKLRHEIARVRPGFKMPRLPKKRAPKSSAG